MDALIIHNKAKTYEQKVYLVNPTRTQITYFDMNSFDVLVDHPFFHLSLCYYTFLMLP